MNKVDQHLKESREAAHARHLRDLAGLTSEADLGYGSWIDEEPHNTMEGICVYHSLPSEVPVRGILARTVGKIRELLGF